MKPTEHLYIKAEITTKSYFAAKMLLRAALAELDYHEANQDKPIATNSKKYSLTIELRKDQK